MNFLAHLLLSGNSEEILLGNFIGDWVKGNKYKNYTENIRTGILLHRKIDSFTDSNTIVKQSVTRLKTIYGRHAGVICDIFYDFFLSINWSKFSKNPLPEFINNAYRIILDNYQYLPEKVKTFLPFLIANNRLHSYSTLIGMKQVLKKMEEYTSVPSAGKMGIQCLVSNYHDFNTEFCSFFPDILIMSEKFIADIDNYQKS